MILMGCLSCSYLTPNTNQNGVSIIKKLSYLKETSTIEFDSKSLTTCGIFEIVQFQITLKQVNKKTYGYKEFRDEKRALQFFKVRKFQDHTINYVHNIQS